MTTSPEAPPDIRDFKAKPPKVAIPNWTDGPSTSFWVLLGRGPKTWINCGDCGTTFKARIHYIVGNPWLQCPGCNTWNYNATEWH